MDGDQVPRLHGLLNRCPTAISTDDPPRMTERDIYSLRDFLLYRAPYDLRLMSVAAITDLPEKGRKLLIVSLAGTDLHIRMFDANGKKIVDKAENELVAGNTLRALKSRLNSSLGESSLSQEARQEIIRDAESIAGHTVEADVTKITDYATITDKQLEGCTYFASRILRMPLRGAADWWHLLKVVDERYPCVSDSEAPPGGKWGTRDERDQKWKEVIDLLGRHCRSTINEDPTSFRTSGADSARA